jgi:hypothetical protein
MLIFVQLHKIKSTSETFQHQTLIVKMLNIS